MSNVQTSAERTPHDMSHFVYTCGDVGCLKVMSHQNLNAGDSIEMNTIGSFRLSPLKRGLALDTCLEVFTFYVPYRHVYDKAVAPDGQSGAWVDFMKKGPAGTATLPVESYTRGHYNVRYLGTRYTTSNTVPLWLSESYRQIYNNYFAIPDPANAYNMPSSIDAMSDIQRSCGMQCNHLKTMWSTYISDAFPQDTTVSTTGGLNIVDLNAAYGNMHSMQERTMFMNRYRDVIQSFGGHTSIDADNRPQLLMRSKFWNSGYDVDGTDQTSLGQFSGRVQQTFNHKVPRWYCPEHGVVMTLVLVRFPPVVSGEVNYLVGTPGVDYSTLAGDPAVVGNSPLVTVNYNQMFADASVARNIQVPHSQWYRYHHSHVDEQYEDVGDFPFVSVHSIDTNTQGPGRVSPRDYDSVFQSFQLGHWNIQCKFNDTVYRRLPSARDALMTD